MLGNLSYRVMEFYWAVVYVVFLGDYARVPIDRVRTQCYCYYGDCVAVRPLLTVS